MYKVQIQQDSDWLNFKTVAKTKKEASQFLGEILVKSPNSVTRVLDKDDQVIEIKAIKPKKEADMPKTTTKAKKTNGKKKTVVVNQNIKLLVKDNPKREGSASAIRFDLYASNKTTDKFLAAGGKPEDLAWDTKKSFIELSPVS